MKSILLFIILIPTVALADAIVLTGHYQGMNLVIQNELAPYGVGYSTFKIDVNGFITTDEIQKDFFEINFEYLELNINDPITVTIHHESGAAPRVLNEMVIKPKSTFEIVDINVSEKHVLSWTTIKENGILPFVIEQYKWNKWVKIGEVNGLGKPEKTRYTFSVDPHSGENKFRVRQFDFTYKQKISPTASMVNPIEKPFLIGSEIYNELEFSIKTHFEIFDINGKFLLRGHSKTVDFSEYEKGKKYYVNYDNIVGETIKKN